MSNGKNKNQLQMKHELAMYLSRRWQERCEFIKQKIEEVKNDDEELLRITKEIDDNNEEIKTHEDELSKIRNRIQELREKNGELRRMKERTLGVYGLTNTEPIVSYRTSIKDSEKPCRNGQLNEDVAEFDRQTEKGIREVLELD